MSDTAWDAAWRSAASRTDDGWSAEFAIPFASIKYTSGQNVTWGLNLARTRRRTLEFDTWAFPLDATGRVSQAGELAGLDLAPPAKRFQVIPYALGRVQQDVDSEFQAGVDARFNVTTTTAVYGTVNPDFATVEADVETVNLTRFEASLPEKRQFFLEGNELYNQRIRTFYGPLPARLLPDQLRDRPEEPPDRVRRRYRQPFGSIQVAYQKGTAPFGQPSSQGHTLFVKATTVF